MLTQEQIKNLKPGDPVIMHGTFDGESPFGNIIIRHKEQMLSSISTKSRVYVHPSAVSLPSEPGTPTKHDPCRLFRKGDKVRVVEWNGRHFHDRDYGVDIETGCVARIYDSEKDDPKKCAVKVAYRKYLFTVPTCFLELVTPVEELEPYRIGKSDYNGFVNIEKKGKIIAMIPYGKELHEHKTEEQALAAAEAERDRLNAEWRKEQK